jgi:GntR family transcriptional regulator/MocR family aminotransferase
VSGNWATSPSGVDLHLTVDTTSGRRAGLEHALREAIQTSRLAPDARLPSTRTLAAELHIARNTVSAAYDQLIAEGYLHAKTGSGTVVALLPARTNEGPSRARTATVRFDLRPGNPDVATFPVSAWVRATRRALAAAPTSAYAYSDPRGRIELRIALAEYLGRTRGIIATPDRIVVTSGYVQALALLTNVLGGAFAMEDPGLPFHREVVRRAGGTVIPLPVDARGARTDLLTARERAVVVTPAHQYPIGVTLHPARRHAATEWARSSGGVVIEDDYDGEFRYDRQPIGALQGMAPDQTIYVGTTSKTLGPALRLAWMVLPDRWVEPVTDAKRYADIHTESIGQLALADLIATHAYDRHIRACRLRYRRRRDLLLRRLRQPVHGIAAGLHALIRLPPGGPTEDQVLAAAQERGLALSSLGEHWHAIEAGRDAGLIVGYGTPTEASYPAALDVLSRVLRSA